MRRVSVHLRKLAAVTSLVAVCGLVLAAGAQAKPGLDPTYGQNGVAAITPTVPTGFRNPQVRQLAAARDGSVYALIYATGDPCFTYCPASFLERFGPTGAPDPTFGQGALASLSGPATERQIAVDAEGRVLAVGWVGGAIQVQRYDLAGNLEPSFGSNGTATFECGCEAGAATITPARRGRILVIGSYIRAEGAAPGGGYRFSLTRLLPDGSLDPTFGSAGSVNFPPKTAYPETVAVAPRGAILLGYNPCCGNVPADTVVRISAAGKLDTRFDRTAAKSLRRLSAAGEIYSLTSLLSRASGSLDLLGESEQSRGYDLRLRANGRLAVNFATRGLARLPLGVASAALGSGGAIFAADSKSTAFRILSDGRLDPAFGGAAGIPTSLSGEPVVVGVQSGGRAVVMNAGLHECRFYCVLTPGIASFVEGTQP
jgi:uncharacterized delta-60 repeat protein